MKFLPSKDEVLTDSKLKLKISVYAPTNAMRFALYDLVQDATAQGRITLSEYIFDNCVSSVKVGTKEIEPEQMKAADLTDDSTAEVYFRCVDLVLNKVLKLDIDTAKKSE